LAGVWDSRPGTGYFFWLLPSYPEVLLPKDWRAARSDQTALQLQELHADFIRQFLAPYRQGPAGPFNISPGKIEIFFDTDNRFTGWLMGNVYLLNH
jgi:hypothetical protein